MIKLDKLTKFYKTGDKVYTGLDDISLEIGNNEFIAITGESGSGKTTLINVISGLDGFDEGSYYFNSQNTSNYSIEEWDEFRSKYISFIFQSYNIIENYTVLENIICAMEISNSFSNTKKEKAIEIANKVGLSERLHHKAMKLSGGEKQRCAIARALAKDSKIIIADEPTGNLDDETSKQIMLLLNEVSKDSLVILITHDYEEVMPYVTRKIKMEKAKIVEDQVIKKNIQIDNLKEKNEITGSSESTYIRNIFRYIKASKKHFTFIILIQTLTIVMAVFVLSFLLESQRNIINNFSSSEKETIQTRNRVIIQKRNGTKITKDEIDKEIYHENSVYYETAYYAFRGIGEIDNNFTTTYSKNAITMESANSIYDQDIEGNKPKIDEIVISNYLANKLDFKIGKQVALLRYNEKFIRNEQYIYSISGITNQGNDETIYFNEKIFENKEIALLGFLNIAKTEISGLSVLPLQKIEFSNELENGTVQIPSHYIELEKPIKYAIKISEYYSLNYQYNVSEDNMKAAPVGTNKIFMSNAQRQEMMDYFFGDDFDIYKINIGVRDEYQYNKVKKAIDQNKYRVIYPIYSNDTQVTLVFNVLYKVMVYAVVFLVLIVMNIFQGILLRSSNALRKKDFLIFRTIGASKNQITVQIMIENAIIFICATLISALAVLLMNQTIFSIFIALRWIKLGYVALILVFSIWILIRSGKRFKNSIFSSSIVSSLTSSLEVEKL